MRFSEPHPFAKRGSPTRLRAKLRSVIA